MTRYFHITHAVAILAWFEAHTRTRLRLVRVASGFFVTRLDR